MTVPVQSTFTASIANGVTTDFPYAFKIASAEDLTVQIDGVTVTTGFTVSGVGEEIGGSVVFSVAPANGAKVLRVLSPIIKRLIDYQQFGDWVAEVVNNDMDRVWLALQAMKRDLTRSLKLPFDTVADQVITEDSAARATKAVKFDASGNLAVSTYDPDTAQSESAASASSAAGSAASASASAGTAETAATEAQAAAENLPNATAAGPDKFLKSNAAGTAWEYLTALAARVALGLGIGSDVMAHVAPGTAGNVLTSDGENWSSSPATGSRQIQPIAASVSSNALTLTLNPTKLDFRSATLTSGDTTTLVVDPAISLVVPSGATLGTIASKSARLIILAINNAGVVELAVVNQAGGLNLGETTLISTTAISTAADSDNVVYSNTARTDVPFRVVGCADIVEATPGTWATGATLVQGSGGQALGAMASLGYGQTRKNALPGKVLGVTYYNETGRPFTIIMSQYAAVATTLTVNGYASFYINGSVAPQFGVAMVMPGETYVVSNTLPTMWTEIS